MKLVHEPGSKPTGQAEAPLLPLCPARCMSLRRESAPRPFWATSKAPQRLAGTLEKLLGAAGDRPIPRYDRGAAYALGDALDHAQLGVGVVVELAPGRVCVRFCDGDRTLVAGR